MTYVWPWAATFAVVSTVAAVQVLDARDFETDAMRERREWLHHIQICHRLYGPATQPEYDETDKLICRSRRGDTLTFRSDV